MDIQTVLLIVKGSIAIILPFFTITQCGKKKKVDPTKSVSIATTEALPQKSGMKASADGANKPGVDDKKDEKKEDEDKKADAQKTEDKKDEDNKEKKDPIASSQKPYPKFVMPTESARKKKEKELEVEKQKKIKEGFYQPKSDEDDTLEKIASLNIEKSDKTKRSTKNKKK